MILVDFQLVLGQAEPDATASVPPGVIFAAGVIGTVCGPVLRVKKPDVYRRLGHGTEPGAYGVGRIDVAE